VVYSHKARRLEGLVAGNGRLDNDVWVSIESCSTLPTYDGSENTPTHSWYRPTFSDSGMYVIQGGSGQGELLHGGRKSQVDVEVLSSGMSQVSLSTKFTFNDQEKVRIAKIVWDASDQRLLGQWADALNENCHWVTMWTSKSGFQFTPIDDDEPFRREAAADRKTDSYAF
jgi:hypothetical protein